MLTEYRKLLSPSKVYIPLTDIDNQIAETLVQVGENVYLGQLVAYKIDGSNKTPILSSVSGEVIGIEERLDRYNKIVDHIVIKNDYKEETVELFKHEGEVASGTIRKVLKELGIKKLDLDSIFTNVELDSRVKHVFVNAVGQNEPFVSTDYKFVLENFKAIADGVLLLGKGANTLDMNIIHDKKMPEEALAALKNELDGKVNFLAINAKEVKGTDYQLIAKKTKQTLKKNLLDSSILYVSIETAKIVSDALRNGLGAFTAHLTVTGEGLKDNFEYDVKVGTLFEDIVEDLGGYQNVEELNIHIGGFLSGTQVESDQFSITETITSVNVSEYHLQKETICIKCGECNDVCPAGILPQNIMDAELRGVNKRIFDLHTDECIECGLCTHVCPSKINVLEWVRRAMRRTV